MRCDRKTMRLYAVTDRAWVGQGTLGDQVEQALRGGVTCVQLREKSLGVPAILVEAEEIGALCRSYGVPFLINDRVEIALQCGADGVHVGQKDRAAREVRRLLGPNRILGVSARTVEQAVQAERDGADYLGVGAVFSTSTKADAMPVSYETLQAICRAVSIPVVAIGGIQRENLLSLAGSGVDGVALVSAIFAAPDVETASRELRALSEAMVRA
ncbi:MAG: thiamine phosphate synthase [Oscillospiraceae bacterium]|mgnify:FL=1